MRLSASLAGGSTTFIAPFAQYDVLHRSSVEAIDVSNGGLGVSAATDGSLLVWSSETGAIQVNIDIYWKGAERIVVDENYKWDFVRIC